MRNWQRNLGLYALLACSATSCAQDNWINWLTNYREALRQAKQTQKPLIVEFRCEA